MSFKSGRAAFAASMRLKRIGCGHDAVGKAGREMQRRAFGAKRAAIRGMVGIAAYVRDALRVCLDDDAAPDAAIRAGGFHVRHGIAVPARARDDSFSRHSDALCDEA